MELPIDIIIRVDAKKENDSGEYTFQCKVLGELVRCGECEYHWKNGGDCVAEREWFCADGKRKDGEHE